MRKQRRQPSFATLTDAEIDQVALWLESETYAAVRLRVNKPRSEGGFGLNISERPLERLWERKKTVDKINTHVSTGEKLTLATFDAISEGDVPASDEIHDAILFETMETVRAGNNTPHRLLALQRLADFPARAEIREERLELNRQKHALRVDMAEHRKRIDNARLDLENRRVQLAEAKAKANPSDP